MYQPTDTGQVWASLSPSFLVYKIGKHFCPAGLKACSRQDQDGSPGLGSAPANRPGAIYVHKACPLASKGQLSTFPREPRRRTGTKTQRKSGLPVLGVALVPVTSGKPLSFSKLGCSLPCLSTRVVGGAGEVIRKDSVE